MSTVAGSLIREARLLPEFAHRYPGIPAGVWLAASDVGAKLLIYHLRASAKPPLGDRLIDDAHFEFRGGSTRGDETPLRTRYGEAEPANPLS